MEQNDKKITSTGKSASGVPKDDSATSTIIEGGAATANQVKLFPTVEQQIQTVLSNTTAVRQQSNRL